MSNASNSKSAVGGLIFLEEIASVFSKEPAEAGIGGPLIMAGLGLRSAGEKSFLLGAISSSHSAEDLALLGNFESGASNLRVLQIAPLVLSTPRLLGASSSYQIRGDPALWRGSTSVPKEVNKLVLANADPAWYAQLLAHSRRDSQVFIDIHSQWIKFRPSETLSCLRAANVVTLTESELQLLPRQVVVQAHLGLQGGPALVIKYGASGCLVRANGREAIVPAPVLLRPASHDVGAGDLLLGLLAAHCPFKPEIEVEDLVLAYERSMPFLAQFLSCDAPLAFLHQHL
jgi:hypothetical protein